MEEDRKNIRENFEELKDRFENNLSESNMVEDLKNNFDKTIDSATNLLSELKSSVEKIITDDEIKSEVRNLFSSVELEMRDSFNSINKKIKDSIHINLEEE